MADGAALLLFAAVAEAPARVAIGPSRVVEIPAMPKDCTRVIIEFGRHKERRVVRWKGSFTLGELKQKKAIQVAAPGDQLLRATMPQN